MHKILHSAHSVIFCIFEISNSSGNIIRWGKFFVEEIVRRGRFSSHAKKLFPDEIFPDKVLDGISNYNKNRDKKVLTVFDDMIADIEYNKHFKRIIKELFYRARKINVSIVFITQSYFRALKDARLNSTHYILMKIGNKKELKSIAE